MEKRRAEYCDFTDIKVLVVTWNVAGLAPKAFIDLRKSVFDFRNNDRPDIIIVGL